MDASLMDVLYSAGLLYEKLCRSAREKHGLSQTELDVLGFLGNNPGMDTARDVTQYRRIPKANVSQAVESLSRSGMLVSRRDENDRRLVRLELTANGREALGNIRAAQRAYERTLTEGFTDEDRKSYRMLGERVAENIKKAL